MERKRVIIFISPEIAVSSSTIKRRFMGKILEYSLSRVSIEEFKTQ